ncbi:uncharacterized protein LACBIDRAFT_314714 [Laccaria bicolor S238N-H82]|uniref:Predicted protein n=1 Tax=Laccaria bicolor (strain S238N-H82 / ATCC MYA-4686) TaxID=486041 RepID=B0DZ31_LACBS|nr:uncharacterized protein LACBIDRAFT_314714 [Laccaria bicolor S238N-H82]EDR00121.1 predicted protein [Laccaria bicolor S238N-H82]|eukprot:XP_001889178.1 predicted protein [Laccaria bicolor S238N-H82]
MTILHSTFPVGFFILKTIWDKRLERSVPSDLQDTYQIRARLRQALRAGGVIFRVQIQFGSRLVILKIIEYQLTPSRRARLVRGIAQGKIKGEEAYQGPT